MEVLPSFNTEESAELAMVSPFMNPELVGRFIKILKGEIRIEDKFKEALIVSYLTRGFKNVAQLLEDEFLEKLKEMGHAEDLINALFAVSEND